MITLDNTPSGTASNTYAVLADADTYFEARVPLSTPWNPAAIEPNKAALIQARRVIDSIGSGRRKLVQGANIERPYWVIGPTWNGVLAVARQALPHPRIGLRGRNGELLDSAINAPELIEAQCELAGLLRISDTTQPLLQAVQGLTKLKAGPVELGFRDFGVASTNPDDGLSSLPPSVAMLIPADWLSEPTIEYVGCVVIESWGD